MADKHWKAAERWYAKRLIGGKRNPVTGERAGIDVESPVVALQIKRGYDIPGYMRTWLDGIIEHGRPSLFPAVVWQEKYRPGTTSLVIMEWQDFEKLVNELTERRRDADVQR